MNPFQLLPNSTTIVGTLSAADKEKIKEAQQQREDALKLMGSLGAATAAVPFGTILPFQNLLENTTVIKQQEAQRMFPNADPNLFDVSRGANIQGKLTNKETIPLSQRAASSRVFDRLIRTDDLYKTEKTYPEYLLAKPDTPSSELGSYQQAVANKTIFPEGDIQAITVTPGPDPSRFAKDYAEILADKLGKAHFEYSQFVSPSGLFHTNKSPETTKELARLENKLETLSNKTPGAAGYIWGNLERPQYSYAEGNWGQGQKFAQENPSIYISRINADPSKEAKYLYTGDILETPYKEPRVRFKQYEDLGPGTGPSWGVTSSRGSSGDIHFRKDLIGARGELTAGDLQALLAERNLPFAYSVQNLRGANRGPGDILRQNLQQLAKAENITEFQAIERFARLVPNVGEPATPATQAVTGILGQFPVEGQTLSPFGSFASKTDLRQLGILPPSDKARYTAFNVDEMDQMFKYERARYNALGITPINSYTNPINPLDPFGNAEEGLSKITIYRDNLRPQAANKLLNKTVENLIEQSKPIQGLGLGGLATGAIATAMDPAVIDALAQGNYAQAGTTAALNTAIGSAAGGATAKGLQALRAAGYARPAAVIGSSLPLAGGVLGGLGLIETGKSLNRAYKAQTGKDWVTRNQPAPSAAYAGPTPSIRPRGGKAVLNGRLIEVPYGSVAGTRTVGRPWWDQAGSRIEQFANLLNRGSIFGR
jgi:hypothetical protein